MFRRRTKTLCLAQACCQEGRRGSILVLMHLAAWLVLCAASTASAQLSIHKLSDSIVDPAALTVTGAYGSSMNAMTYHQDAHISHLGWQYVTYYDAQRHVCVGRRRLPTGPWQIIRLTDYAYTGDDTHRIISMGICKQDGTIHLSFDQLSSQLRYRASMKNIANEPEKFTWNTSLFSPVQTKLGSITISTITYPRFIQTPEGGLQFSGLINANSRTFYDYTPATTSWIKRSELDSPDGTYVDIYGTSTRRLSYPNDYDYDTSGRLHATWTWRERIWGVNHDIMYAYSDNKGATWHNNAGTTLTAPARVDTPGMVVVPVSIGYGMINDQAQTVDSKGRVHLVMYHSQLENTDTTTITKIGWASAEGARYFHYWRDTNGSWMKFMLSWPSGNRPKLLVDKEDSLYLIYQRAGYLRIARATAAAQWKDWQVIHSETGPFINEMLADRVRWKEDGIFSILVQERPPSTGGSSPIRIIEFYFGAPSAVNHWNLYDADFN